VTPYELVAERSLALHAAVAERLRREPGLVELARRRVEGWAEHGNVARVYVDRWMTLIDAPLADLVAALVERSERMHDLRQVSPFAGFLSARTRWRLHREIGERLRATR
jgi:hypothetical protein